MLSFFGVVVERANLKLLSERKARYKLHGIRSLIWCVFRYTYGKGIAGKATVTPVGSSLNQVGPVKKTVTLDENGEVSLFLPGMHSCFC